MMIGMIDGRYFLGTNRFCSMGLIYKLLITTLMLFMWALHKLRYHNTLIIGH
jgi:hypothetical protein